ncbi:MAG: DUF6508 domain-containing protein [Polyangiales bacterium]
MKSRLTEEYGAGRDRYESTFPEAHHFLVSLENDVTDGVWLSTAKNAHIYKDDGFFAYLVLRDVTHASPSLVLSPHFNLRIVTGTVDRSSLLFPTRIRAILERHASDRHAWWTSTARGAFELRKGTPESVFEELLDLMRGMTVDGPRPNREDLLAVTAYADVFDAKGFSAGKYDTKSGGLPTFDLSPQVGALVNDIYARRILFSFNWPSWAEEGRRLEGDDQALARADVLTLRKLLTMHVRADRFSDGHVAGLVRSGQMSRLLRRLGELAKDV